MANKIEQIDADDVKWIFRLPIINYVECSDSPVCVYDLPELTKEALAWCKNMKPNNFSVFHISHLGYDIEINDMDFAATFKLLWT